MSLTSLGGAWRGVKAQSGPVLRLLLRSWQTDRVMGLAAEVAFWSVLSFFPLLIATSATLGWLDSFGADQAAKEAQDGMIDAFRDILTDDAKDMTADLDKLTERTSPGLLTASALGALWTSSRGFAAIIRALDVAYNLEEKRSFVHTRAIAVGMSLGSVLVGAIMLALVVVGPLLGTGDDLANHFGLGDVFTFLWNWVRWPVLLAGTVLWATTVLHVAPNHTTPWRWDIPGAVLTTILWGLFSFGLRFYLMFAGDSNEVMGILGGSLIALIWLFLLAIGLLVGGELNASLVQLGIAPPDRAALKDRQAAKKAASTEPEEPVETAEAVAVGEVVELTDQEVPSESVKPS